jgi:hypothetical protein
MAVDEVGWELTRSLSRWERMEPYEPTKASAVPPLGSNHSLDLFMLAVRTGVMGYTSEHYVLEECDAYGRDYSFCDLGAECAFFDERTVRAVRHQPQDGL